MRGSIKLTLTIAVCLLTISTAFPAYAKSGVYLTNGITESAMKQATVGPYNGVLLNYTNTYASSFGAFIYLSLTNSAGQTVYWHLGSCGFAAGQKVQCFIIIDSTVPRGNYTAWAFATTNSSIPVSTTSSVRVTMP